MFLNCSLNVIGSQKNQQFGDLATFLGSMVHNNKKKKNRNSPNMNHFYFGSSKKKVVG